MNKYSANSSPNKMDRSSFNHSLTERGRKNSIGSIRAHSDRPMLRSLDGELPSLDTYKRKASISQEHSAYSGSPAKTSMKSLKNEIKKLNPKYNWKSLSSGVSPTKQQIINSSSNDTTTVLNDINVDERLSKLKRDSVVEMVYTNSPVAQQFVDFERKTQSQKVSPSSTTNLDFRRGLSVSKPTSLRDSGMSSPQPLRGTHKSVESNNPLVT
mmetsp:Transcript_33850/g.30653  ORF Transcript_33850/g.30653 Transcript_33850/m.30653 type:complete len:212 (-) Transcript_33850:457-1092(-)